MTVFQITQVVRRSSCINNAQNVKKSGHFNIQVGPKDLLPWLWTAHFMQPFFHPGDDDEESLDCVSSSEWIDFYFFAFVFQSSIYQLTYYSYKKRIANIFDVPMSCLHIHMLSFDDFQCLFLLTYVCIRYNTTCFALAVYFYCLHILLCLQT